MEGVASAIDSPVNVDIFPDVNVLITLTLNQPTFLTACQKFRDDVIRETIGVKITASVRRVFDYKVLGVNDLVGRVLGGLTNHLSVTTTRGRDELLEKATLAQCDKQILRGYFKNQILAADSELGKNQLRAVEAWVIRKFDDALRSAKNPVLLVEFLGFLFELSNDANEDFNTNYAMLHNDLQIGAPVSVNPPNSSSRSKIELAGVHDPEDIDHLASIWEYIIPQARKAVFATTDYKDVIANQAELSKLEIYCETPTYAVDAYKSLL